MPALEERLIWNRICSDSENCLAERCAFRQEDKCFFYRARQQAEGAQDLEDRLRREKGAIKEADA